MPIFLSLPSYYMRGHETRLGLQAVGEDGAQPTPGFAATVTPHVLPLPRLFLPLLDRKSPRTFKTNKANRCGA